MNPRGSLEASVCAEIAHLNAKLCLTLTSTLAEIQILSEAFLRFAAEHALPSLIQADVNLAMEEIVTNVIVHGYRGERGHQISVAIELGPKAIVVQVEDSAPPFNPLQAPDPDLRSPLPLRKTGGLGIYLAKQFLNSMEYERVGDKNRTVLRRLL
jgi:anti-sigma regulatory factor (Ser/Thr protein kinase)